MKGRILLINNTKAKKIALIILPLVFIAVLSTGMMSAGKHLSKDDIKNTFFHSVNYDPTIDLLSFTIPETIPKGYKFYLHVSGRMFMGNKLNVMSFHAFEEESINFSWINGKTYTYPLKSDNLVECLLVFGLVENNTQEILYAIHILPDGTKSNKRIN